MLHFHPVFRAGAWILIVAGFWYLYLGAREATVAAVRPAYAVVGVAAIVVGTALLRWIRRSGD
jgi:hypothetical protein